MSVWMSYELNTAHDGFSRYLGKTKHKTKTINETIQGQIIGEAIGDLKSWLITGWWFALTLKTNAFPNSASSSL